MLKSIYYKLEYYFDNYFNELIIIIDECFIKTSLFYTFIIIKFKIIIINFVRLKTNFIAIIG